MNKRYSKKEKQKIAEEAKKIRNKSGIALKYGIHLSTLYEWISLLHKSKNRNKYVTIKLSEEEKEILLSRCKELGYENEVSSYIRKLIFSKHIATGNPRDLVKELYLARGEMNKAGSNINQIANYVNFLRSNNYIDQNLYDDFRNQGSSHLRAILEHRAAIDKILKKI
tara:strand:- start:147 stop:650 length:504 start_codon:yes stop_codon:yes gene_type:complete